MKLLSSLLVAALGIGVLLTSLSESPNSPRPLQVAEAHQDSATFAGGCFWCMEAPFDKLDGVLSTTSGYTGGHVKNPTYREVSSGRTGHAEAVQIVYDSTAVSYEKLLETFWHNIDPTQADGQFCDKGNQYRSAIFYHNEHQKNLAEESKSALEQSDRFDTIVTEIQPLSEFYVAEEYHQNFYKTHPARYQQYRKACGRDRRLRQLWGEAKTSSLF